MHHTTPRRHRGLRAAAAAAGVTLLATGCGTADAENDDAQASTATGSGDRLAVSYQDGVAVLDAESLEVIEEYASQEFTRLNPAGDGRHVLVTTSAGFQVLATATCPRTAPGAHPTHTTASPSSWPTAPC